MTQMWLCLSGHVMTQHLQWRLNACAVLSFPASSGIHLLPSQLYCGPMWYGEIRVVLWDSAAAPRVFTGDWLMAGVRNVTITQRSLSPAIRGRISHSKHILKCVFKTKKQDILLIKHWHFLHAHPVTAIDYIGKDTREHFELFDLAIGFFWPLVCRPLAYRGNSELHTGFKPVHYCRSVDQLVSLSCCG